MEHPDELRIDIDPQPGTTFRDGKRVAALVQEVLGEIGFTGWPKTSGNRGIHVFCRIELNWEFPASRRAALAFAREVERRLPKKVTTAWWKEERGKRVFIDYNQNARDRTVASAYSVRGRPDATVSAPVTWHELTDVETEDFSMATMPARFEASGVRDAGIDQAVCDLVRTFEWVERRRRGHRRGPVPRTSRRCQASPRSATARARTGSPTDARRGRVGGAGRRRLHSAGRRLRQRRSSAAFVFSVFPPALTVAPATASPASLTRKTIFVPDLDLVSESFARPGRCQRLTACCLHVGDQIERPSSLARSVGRCSRRFGGRIAFTAPTSTPNGSCAAAQRIVPFCSHISQSRPSGAAATFACSLRSALSTICFAVSTFHSASVLNVG